MCDIDFDSGEYCSVFEESLVGRARKRRLCDMCRCVIEMGSSYIRHFSVFDSSATTEARCLPCDTITQAFRREHRIKFGPSSMREMLVECLQEESYYGDETDGEDDLIPTTDSALRWKYALIEMDTRRASEADRRMIRDAAKQASAKRKAAKAKDLPPLQG